MSMLPSHINSGLSAFGEDVVGFFRTADNLVQSVTSIYDQFSGKSQSVPSQINPAVAPAPAPAPAPVKASEANLLDSGTLAFGAVILIGVLLLIRD